MGINAGALVNGALRGYNFVDEEIDETKNEQMQRTAIDRQYAMQDKQEARAERQDQRQQKTFDRQSRLLTKRELEPDAARAWAAYRANGYKNFDPEFAQRAKAAGETHYLPEYWSTPGNLESNVKASGMMLESLKSGNIEEMNSPEFIKEINTVYADKIRKGIDETHQETGKKIVDKKIVGFDMAPVSEEGGQKRGRVVPRIIVTLEDGTQYEAHSTMGASSASHDPILMEDAGELMDDLIGRGQAAQSIMSDPEFMSRMKAADSALGYRKERQPLSPQGKLLADRNALDPNDPDRKFFDQNLKSKPEGKPATPSNLEKEIEYIQKKGKEENIELSFQDARDIANMPSFDPGEFVGEYVSNRLELQNDIAYDGEVFTEDELIEKGIDRAERIQRIRLKVSPKQEEQDDRVKQVMQANPGKSVDWVNAYLKHLDASAPQQ